MTMAVVFNIAIFITCLPCPRQKAEDRFCRCMRLILHQEVHRSGDGLALDVTGDLGDGGVGELAEPLFGGEREHGEGEPCHG